MNNVAISDHTFLRLMTLQSYSAMSVDIFTKYARTYCFTSNTFLQIPNHPTSFPLPPFSVGVERAIKQWGIVAVKDRSLQ